MQEWNDRLQSIRSSNTENGLVVTKSNRLIQKTHYDLNSQEQKLIMRLIAMVDPQNDTAMPVVELSIGEFSELCGIDRNSGKNRRNIRASIQNCASKTFWITPEGTQKQVLVRWLNLVVIDPRNDKILLGLDPMLTPYLTQMKSFFTEYNVEYILRMHSQYSIRLYELCKSYENLFCPTDGSEGIPHRDFDVEELKDSLSAVPLTEEEKRRLSVSEIRKRTPLGEKYRNFTDFKRNVLDVAEREINALTDLNVQFLPVKSGRQGKKFDIVRMIVRHKTEEEMQALEKRRTASGAKVSRAAAIQLRTVERDDMSDIQRMPALNTRGTTIPYAVGADPEAMADALRLRADPEALQTTLNQRQMALLDTCVELLAGLCRAGKTTKRVIDGANADMVEQVNDVVMDHHGMREWFEAILPRYERALHEKGGIENPEGYLVACLKRDLKGYRQVIEQMRRARKGVQAGGRVSSPDQVSHRPVSRELNAESAGTPFPAPRRRRRLKRDDPPPLNLERLAAPRTEEKEEGATEPPSPAPTVPVAETAEAAEAVEPKDSAPEASAAKKGGKGGRKKGKAEPKKKKKREALSREEMVDSVRLAVQQGEDGPRRLVQAVQEDEPLVWGEAMARALGVPYDPDVKPDQTVTIPYWMAERIRSAMRAEAQGELPPTGPAPGETEKR